jgi:hypothetical protein
MGRRLVARRASPAREPEVDWEDGVVVRVAGWGLGVAADGAGEVVVCSMMP